VRTDETFYQVEFVDTATQGSTKLLKVFRIVDGPSAALTVTNLFLCLFLMFFRDLLA
jgi:hypothetical protein